ncbi:NAD(P)/FAD-dependent oxidoreductase [Telmatocola sphagniphila]|uniref:Pyridine nucleotide-disulfide oxidoreductase domain-containing protein 2 n=1 Tax=Telmatocola sphagniphila TaxID=1123043 RepID=A0A8E6B762_9BACT|nr:NAD(P)/FAD-dependent oxidoreductase [Telmatocola sphagniphila]QVL32529.1 NAD(P)/FAD-dependent oxidoreductase [Telmatocola sphagniphila]
MPESYDAIIIGGGHNGLVCAAYLGRAGCKVLVLERREVLGGCCVTEEIWPGYKVSPAAYVNSLLRPEIIRDLDLKKHGFAMLPRNPSSFTPFPDGRYLMMGPDREATQKEIAKFSHKDAEAYPQYEAMLEKVAAFLEPLLVETPPDPWGSFRDLTKLARLGWKFRKLGRKVGVEAIEILSGAARPILDRWFESDELKATIATDAVIGAFAAPSMPGTAYVLFHHVMGECDGAKGVWGYVRGGMGTISNSIAAAARAVGVEIRTEAEVGRILIKEGRATGVALRDGTEFHAKRVISNADANVTFLKLTDPKELPDDFRQAVKNIDYSSATVKINVCVSEPPQFKALPGTGVGPQHHGTMHICPSPDYIERAYDEAKYGRPSENPMLECTMATALDNTLAPAGKHIISMFIQYAPYHLKGTTWELEMDKFADRCFDILNEYAPNFKNSVIDRMVIPPPEMERLWGITGGNIMQGSMGLASMFSLRPVAGFANYKSPIKGLYMCGAATHPGGGVMGACGWNAARAILKDKIR